MIMKIPNYIRKAIEMRTKYAYRLMELCDIVDTYLEKIGVDVHNDDFFDCAFGNVEIYCNPRSAERELLSRLEAYKIESEN